MSTPEEIRYEGQQQDREDKRREMLERRGRMGGPDVEEACEECGGEGTVPLKVRRFNLSRQECPRCLGSKVQP